MKVICINEPTKRYVVATGKQLPLLMTYVGSEYNVLKEKMRNGRLFYILSEFSPTQNRTWFLAANFAPISMLDETELVNEKKEVYA